MKLDLYSFTNPGGRPYNEDRCAAVQPADRPPLLLLADGLGGHGDGDKAAELAIQALTDAWQAADPSPEETVPALLAAIGKANEAVVGAQAARRSSMRCTLVAAAPLEQGLAFAWCGDSRIYLVHAGAVRLLTRDHSVTFKKYQAGVIERRQINRDEDRTSLLRAVGDKERCLPEGEFLPLTFAPGDGVLLCSDGLWEYLEEEEILADCLKADNAAGWARGLLLRVMERVAPNTDNLTLLAGMSL